MAVVESTEGANASRWFPGLGPDHRNAILQIVDDELQSRAKIRRPLTPTWLAPVASILVLAPLVLAGIRSLSSSSHPPMATVQPEALPTVSVNLASPAVRIQPPNALRPDKLYLVGEHVRITFTAGSYSMTPQAARSVYRERGLTKESALFELRPGDVVEILQQPREVDGYRVWAIRLVEGPTASALEWATSVKLGYINSTLLDEEANATSQQLALGSRESTSPSGK